MRLRRKVLLAALCIAATLWASDKPTGNKTPVTPAFAASGKDLFVNYCAVCHGSDGKGTGPAANSLRVLPADLTLLSRKNGGKFPSSRVINILRGEADLPTHHDKEMPVWAPAFESSDPNNPAGGQQRVAKLLKFIESLQAK